MRTIITRIFDRIQESVWFIPALGAACGLLLAVACRWIDATDFVSGPAFLTAVQPSSASGVRAVLATTASTMIGLAGVSFSITVVALSLASSQFGSRLLRNFIRDPRNHMVLGILLGVFVYCLTLLSTVREDAGANFYPPTIGLLVTFVAALAGLGAFTYFVHHVATEIQASSVVTRVRSELEAAVARLFPDADESAESLPCDGFGNQDHRTMASRVVGAPVSGYVQAIAIEGLVAAAKQVEGVIEVQIHPGSYVISGNEVFRVYCAEDPGEAAMKKIAACCLQGWSRTMEQDFEFAIHQLVEVALRALSPGINDPFTAINCIDNLGSAYAMIAERAMPGNVVRDAEGNLRVLLQPVTFADVFDAGMAQLRQNALSTPAVSLRLLEMILQLLPHLCSDADREAVLRQARAIAGGAISRASDEIDKGALRERLERIEQGAAGQQ